MQYNVWYLQYAVKYHYLKAVLVGSWYMQWNEHVQIGILFMSSIWNINKGCRWQHGINTSVCFSHLNRSYWHWIKLSIKIFNSIKCCNILITLSIFQNGSIHHMLAPVHLSVLIFFQFSIKHGFCWAHLCLQFAKFHTFRSKGSVDVHCKIQSTLPLKKPALKH